MGMIAMTGRETGEDILAPQRTVLVTGGMGFIGLNAIGGLLDAGYNVRVVTRGASSELVAWLEAVKAGRSVELVVADIGTATPDSAWLTGLDSIIHLAGESGAAQSLQRSAREIHRDTEAQLYFLDAVRRLSEVPHVVFVSSRLVYGVTGGRTVRETSATAPTSLYAANKLSVEGHLQVYGRLAKLPWTILRVTNPYGPFQSSARWTHGIVNRFVHTALTGGTITLFGGGEQLRDVLFVDDVVRALIRSLETRASRLGIFNIGSGASIPLATIAQEVVRAVGNGSIESCAWPEMDRIVETGDFRCSTSKARRVLGWRAETSIEEGLRRTVEWYGRRLASSGDFDQATETR